jgi:hypothetical protein
MTTIATRIDTADITRSLGSLFAELTEGQAVPGSYFILNTGDRGLLSSLNRLSAQEASASAHDGATIAAHTQHLRYGLDLMNRWATEGGNPFADATWDAAWRISAVDDAQWTEIRSGLTAEVANWRRALESRRTVTEAELSGMIGSIAHLAYHLGAIRQISRATRGPKEGTFKSS